MSQRIPDALTGTEAARIGLVTYAVPPEEVLPRARALAQRLADGPTWAIRWSKLAVNKWLKQQATLIMDAGLASCTSPAARSAPLDDPES